MTEAAGENNAIYSSSAVHKHLSPSSFSYLPPSPSPSLTLPFELVEEILCRLSVKLLLQFRCVCKSWNSLISDHKFAKKHLTNSTTHWINWINTSGLHHPILTLYSPNSIFYNNIVSSDVKRIIQYTDLPSSAFPNEIVGSCNGILCFAYKKFILLWNPSIRKSKELPRLQMPHHRNLIYIAYGFGYDSVTDNYKVVAVIWEYTRDSSGNLVAKTQVNVNTMGSKFWKNIGEFPFGTIPNRTSGKYLNGTINWLAFYPFWHRSRQCFIVSLDLSNESYQMISQPDYGEVNVYSLALDVLRDCLCMISGHDVWVMKEYGSKESWTKLFTISYMQDPSMLYSLTKVIYVFDDGQLLLQCKTAGARRLQLILYDPRIGTFEFVTFQKSSYDSWFDDPEVVCIESLISPCSYF